MKRLSMKRRLTLHKHTPTHTHTMYKNQKENEIRRTMKTKNKCKFPLSPPLVLLRLFTENTSAHDTFMPPHNANDD